MRVKFFSGDDLERLEEEINGFLDRYGIDETCLKSVKQTQTIDDHQDLWTVSIWYTKEIV